MKAKQPKESSTPSGPNVLKIEGDAGKREQLVADVTVEGLLTSAVILRSYSSVVAGDIGITETVRALRSTIKTVSAGDLGAAETMLIGQAGALNVMFAELARRAALNMGTHLSAMETYLRLALKAQAQSRATLETLAAIKNPPVVFARQANINHGGQQQVNNGTAPAGERAAIGDGPKSSAEPLPALDEPDSTPGGLSRLNLNQRIQTTRAEVSEREGARWAGGPTCAGAVPPCGEGAQTVGDKLARRRHDASAVGVVPTKEPRHEPNQSSPGSPS